MLCGFASAVIMSTLNNTPFSDADHSDVYTDKQGDPVALDLLLQSDVPLDDLSGEECAELNQALATTSGDDEEDAAPSANPAFSAAARKATVETYPDSIFARLVEFNLLKKVTDIVLAKVKIPWSLRDDAAQAMHLKWCTIKALPQYQRNQLAFYAFKSGQHAALAERRTLGAVCVLPGALFREGKESAFMETIGAAVNPMDVDEYKDSMELSIEEDDMMRLARVTEGLLDERLGKLALSPKQRKVAYMVLIERKDASEIAAELTMREVYVERLIKQVTLKLNNSDAGIEEPEEPRVKKAVAKPARKVAEKAEKPVEKVKAPLGATTRLRRRSVSRQDRAERGVTL